jgi:HAD superfamily hydrolase (TIGR01509 family)
MTGVAFLFDMSGVLLDFDLHTLKRRVAEASGAPLRHIDRTWRDDPYMQSELGQVTSREYYRHFAARLRLGWSYERWIAEWVRIVTHNENGTALFAALRAADQPVYILSNLAEYHRDAVSAAVPGFWNASSGNFLSYELGLCKPSAALFDAACARIGRPPQECYFFDDDEANTLGASRVGIRAFRFCAENMAAIRRSVQPYCEGPRSGA